MINLPSVSCVMALEMLPIIGARGLVNPHEYYRRNMWLMITTKCRGLFPTLEIWHHTNDSSGWKHVPGQGNFYRGGVCHY